MTVAELQQRMTSREFSEWMVYYMLEPFGEERSDIRAGIVASTIANVNRGKNTKAYQPRDFIPEFGRSEKARQQEIDLKLKVLSAMMKQRGPKNG